MRYSGSCSLCVGALLLEKLSQPTHNSQAIKGRMFLTLQCVFFSFFFHPFTAVLQTVMSCFTGYI